MSDRKDHIKVLYQMLKQMEWVNGIMPTSSRIDALRFAINSLEVDEAYQMEYEKSQSNWIHVSERLPEVGGEYLLWGRISKDDEDDYCFIGEYHEFDEEFGIEQGCYDEHSLGFLGTELDKYYSVIAWMPLPQPYKGDKE